jgi:hypothetical protein
MKAAGAGFDDDLGTAEIALHVGKQSFAFCAPGVDVQHR